jgi:hypothetical protein
MLPNEIVDYIVLRNFGEDHEGLGSQQGQGGRLGGVQVKVEAQIISELAISDSGPACTKFISQATYGLRFQ